MSEMSTGASIQMKLDSWRGYSAYEIAVKNGFEGTEAQWLESLKGEPAADANAITVNNKEAVDGNITVRATDIYVEAGLATTVSQALARCVSTDIIVDALDCEEPGKVLGAAQGKTLADRIAPKAQGMTQLALLPADAWVEEGEMYTQNAAVAGVTIDRNKTSVIVSPPADRAMEEVYLGCEVRASEQGDGTLVFTCTDLPDIDLEANVMVVVLGTPAAADAKTEEEGTE